MGYEARQENIEAFNETEDVRIFLLSTRAGGLVSYLVFKNVFHENDSAYF